MQADIVYKIFKTKIQHFFITFYGYKDIWWLYKNTFVRYSKNKSQYL